MHNYTYGLEQEGHFIPRARVTFQPFAGCWIVYESKYGWSNYFGTSTLYSKNEIAKTLESFTKSWGVALDDEDWPILKEIYDRKVPEYKPRLLSNNKLDQYGWRAYEPNEQDLFYAQRDKDIESYITSKLGWK